MTITMPMTVRMTIIERSAASISADFDLFDDWEDRFGFLIEQARELEPLHPDEHRPENLVRGCASQVWVLCEVRDHNGVPHLRFRADSDAILVKGLLALLVRLFNDQPAQDILAFDARAFLQEIGLGNALTQQRANGLASMLQFIYREAARALGET